MTGADESEGKNRSRFAKQAVVIVHGMGEQRPMGTINGFVDTMWVGDDKRQNSASGSPGAIWSKPDGRTGSFELRRVTTRESRVSDGFPAGVRTDFYELYWADLTAGSPWEEITGWLRSLLFRNPFDVRSVPRNVLSAWILLWVAALLIVAAGIVLVFPSSGWGSGIWTAMHVQRWVAAAGLIFAWRRAKRSLTKGFGRVVRYTRSTPANIAARAAVRERGLKLLEGLHDPKEDYARIIVVGHSLGSILAYDLLGILWARRRVARTVAEDEEAFGRLCALEAAAQEVADADAPSERYLEAQRAFRTALAARTRALASGNPDDDPKWLVSDFVTMGSPLAHASFLMADDVQDLERRQHTRELPTSPPMREHLEGDQLRKAEAAVGVGPIVKRSGSLFCFPSPTVENAWELHHAALFAAVRWTNISDRARLIFQGDQISGRIGPLFGHGVVDVDLHDVRGQATRFTHTRYWAGDAGARALDCARDALNLLDDPGSDPRDWIAVEAAEGSTSEPDVDVVTTCMEGEERP